MSRSSRVSALGPPAIGLAAIVGRSDHLVAADPLVDHDEAVAIGGMQAARQHVRPAVVAVDRGARAVGDRIAERDDDLRLGRRPSCRPRRGSTRRSVEKGNAASPSSWPLAPEPGGGDVGGLQRLGVPGHRPALAHDMEADRELAARAAWDRRRLHEGQRHRIAHHALARRDGDAVLAAELHRLVGALARSRCRSPAGRRRRRRR